MANLANIRDNKGWLTKRVVFDRYDTHASVGDFGDMYGFVFDLSSLGAQISRVHKENEVKECYFHIVSLASGLRFPLLGFILEVLNDYGIAPS